jgi:3-methyladenine DNA glycosylase AlkD
MTPTEVMRAIEAKGKPATATVYRRHGITEPTVGLSYADIGALVKRLGTDHRLALDLWKTGMHDARIVATKIADPTRLTPAALRAWLNACANYVITDAVAAVAADAPGSLASALEWIDDPGEWVSSAGWTTLSLLAMRGALEDTVGERLVTRIERGIHDAPNRTRHAMNGALIAIGGAMPGLRVQALAAARGIGRVAVDHGETGCKTPDASAMIGKMVARRAAAKATAKAPARARR